MQPSPLAAGVYLGRPEHERRAGALAFARTLYAPGQRIAAHAHGTPYLCLALSGSFRERSGDAEAEVVAGSAVLHRAGETHADRFGPAPARCLNVSFDPAWARGLCAWLEREGPPLYSSPGAVGALVRRLEHEFEQRDEASELALEGLTLEILAFFVRGERRAEKRAPGWMAATLARLRAEARVSLAELAREARVHPATLARAFRRFQGCSPGEYRRRWRLARACEALREGDAPLAEIAERHGFADQSHLTRAVRAAVGLAPAAYRRAARRG